jgi:Protein of unknown function (DUF1559)
MSLEPFNARTAISFATLVSALLLACNKKSDAPSSNDPLAKEKEQSRANLQRMTAAFLDYSDSIFGIPVGLADPKTGMPILSWRVQILPYLGDPEAEALYKEFKLDEPWDSEHNKKLIPRMPKIYADVRGQAPEGSTYYQGFYPVVIGSDGKEVRAIPLHIHYGFFFHSPLFKEGPNIPFRPEIGKPITTQFNMRNITDGAANCFLIAEAGEAVPWTKPHDIGVQVRLLPRDKFRIEALPPMGKMFDGDFHVVAADGTVHWVKKSIPPEKLQGFFTAGDGEMPDWAGAELLESQPKKDNIGQTPAKPPKIKFPSTRP